MSEPIQHYKIILKNETDIFWGVTLTQSLPWVTDRQQSLNKNEILYLIQKELVDKA